MKSKILIIFLFCFCLSIYAQPLKEIRAVWLTLNYGLDFPSRPIRNNYDFHERKQELTQILDELQAANINMIFFQTRLRGDVVYPSEIEPFNLYVKNANNSLHPSNDILQYAIEEAHNRGMELHAWFVTYPLGTRRANSSAAVKSDKELVRTYNNELYLDPGEPGTNQYLLRLIKEIVSSYDIDGFHFDYIRYPDKPAKFPDQTTYRKYGDQKNIADWRRENVNRFVYQAYDLIKELKPWVQVSSSVVGMYKKIPGNKTAHWTSYDDVYQDPIDWIEKGKHDFLVPMMYYRDKLFFPFVNDWVERTQDRFIIPGLGLYRMDQAEGNWSLEAILDQIEYSRENLTNGNALYRVRNLLSDQKGVLTTLKDSHYALPALLPPLTWLNDSLPAAPGNPEAVGTENTLCLSWESAGDDIFYNVYQAPAYPTDSLDNRHLIAIRLRSNSFQVPIDTSVVSGSHYIITAYDRYRNESLPSEDVYFVTGVEK